MPIAAVMLDLGFPPAAVKARPDPRAHRRPARPPGRGARASRSASSMAAAAEEAVDYEPAGGRRLMLEPEVETRPWAEQLALDDARYRAQLAYLFERSAFYRDKLAAAGFADAREAGGLAEIARAAADREAGAARDRDRRATRSAPTSARRRDEIVRIYSTSGTTGTPSYIPLTAGDLDNWVDRLGAQLRRLGRRGRPAHRLHLQRRAVRGRRGARRVRPHRPLPHPGRHGQHRAAAEGGRAARARGRGAHALLRGAPGRVGGRPRLRPAPAPASSASWSPASPAAASRRSARSSRTAGARG